MTLREADRLAVLKRIEEKNITLRKAASELGVSYRQVKRIWSRYKQMGTNGVISLRRGKPSSNQLPLTLKKEALEIIQTKYADYGPTLAMEKLKDKHRIPLSKETVRQLMISAGFWKGKKRKELKVHSRRTRRSRVGELVQIDGSYEHWFEDRGEKCCLIVFVDDASSRIALMRFCKHETVENYLQLLRSYLGRYGRPEAFYSDKHSIFRVNQKERCEKGKYVTRFHEVLKQLDIELICAHSPQAKGRVERAHGTLQDRLIKEMRERGFNSMEEGNQFLDEFTEFYNSRFGKEPAFRENAHRAVLSSHNLEQLVMLKTERVIAKDMTFHYRNEIYQVDINQARSMQGKKVQVFESEGEIKMVLKDGKSVKYWKWKEQLTDPVVVLDVKELEAYCPSRNRRKPRKYHPWR